MGTRRIQRTEDEIRIESSLRDARIAAGLTQARLAYALDVSVQQIHNYEKGSARIAASTLKTVAEFLDVPIGAFFDPQARDDRRAPRS